MEMNLLDDKIEIQDDHHLYRAVRTQYFVNGKINELAFSKPGPGISVLIAEESDPHDLKKYFSGSYCAIAKVAPIRSVRRSEPEYEVSVDVEHKPSWHRAHAHVEAFINLRKAKEEGWKTLCEIGVMEEIMDNFHLINDLVIGEMDD